MLKLLALGALDWLVYRATNKRYTIMPVDVLDRARPNIQSPSLRELDDAIYHTLCGRGCEIRNLLRHYNRTGV